MAAKLFVLSSLACSYCLPAVPPLACHPCYHSVIAIELASSLSSRPQSRDLTSCAEWLFLIVVFLFSRFLRGGYFPLFCLETKKWSKKVQGRPDRSARASGPAHKRHSVLVASGTLLKIFHGCLSSLLRLRARRFGVLLVGDAGGAVSR
jgi:hypothetical protein